MELCRLRDRSGGVGKRYKKINDKHVSRFYPSRHKIIVIIQIIQRRRCPREAVKISKGNQICSA